MTGGGFPLYVALFLGLPFYFFLGLPFLLFGLAVVLSSSYPSWPGWLGVIAGGGAFLVGTVDFAGFEFLPIQLFVPFVFLADFWMLAMGILMWRRVAR